MDDTLFDSFFLPAILLVTLVIIALRHGFERRQMSYLDHQTTVSNSMVAQNKAYETMIAEQYRLANERSDRALAQSEQAMEMNSAALRELTAMRETLTLIASRMGPDRT